MLQRIFNSSALILLIGVFTFSTTTAQQLQQQQDYDRHEGYQSNEVRIDRYLNVEVWTDHDDGEYYEGDRVTIYFRASRDAFVAIYSIDTKGRVHMLFPSSPNQDNYVVGGVTHSLPSRNDDYDLVISGPEGVENVQVIASRERFPIPDWYPNSGMFCDWENRHDYMDWVNSQFFVKYGGQSFAYDRTAMYVYEWEPNYFRPVYRPYYPGWTVTGNVYVDYGWGSSIYIDGIYWGCAPLYLPRLYVGWHTFTVYDRWGYCWERDVHVTRYNTVVLDYNVIVTRPDVRSKYKSVHFAGYQDPVKVGYNDFDKKVKVISESGAWDTRTTTKQTFGDKVIEKNRTEYIADRKFVRGSSKIVTTERGIETAGAEVKRTEDKRGVQGFIDKNSGSRATIDRSKRSDQSTGSIFKRRGTDTQSDRKSGPSVGQSQLKRSDVKRKGSSSSVDSRGSNSGSTSGSYKKSSSSPVKRKSAPSVKQRQKNDDSKNTAPAPKKSSGNLKSGSSDKKSSSTAPKKSSPPKKSSSGSKKKGGGK